MAIRPRCAALTLCWWASTAEAQEIQIDASQRFQIMQGFGTTERVFDDPHVFDNFDPATERSLTIMTTAEQDEILDRLYTDLGLTRVRPAMDGAPSPIEEINDNSDPNSLDLSAFNFAWKRNDAHVDYVSRAAARGARTWFLSPIVLESFMDESNPEECAEWALAILMRWRDMGYTPQFYSVVNEPGYIRSGIWSGEYIRDVIANLGPRLVQEGLAIQFVIPDDLNATQALARSEIILADPAARPYVGAIAYHLYDAGEGGDPADRLRLKDLADQHGLPIWMTEWYLPDPTGIAWASTVHTLIADEGASAVDYLWGFFGEWEGTDSMLVQLNYNGAAYTGRTLFKRYYTFGQYSRFVRPGAQRIAAETTTELRVSAFLDGPEIIAVVVNDSATAHTANLRVNGGPDLEELRVIRTSATEDWAELPPIPIAAGTFAATFPGGSVTTLIGRDMAQPPADAGTPEAGGADATADQDAAPGDAADAGDPPDKDAATTDALPRSDAGSSSGRESDCGCRASNAPSSPAPLLLLAVLALLRTRARPRRDACRPGAPSA